MDILSAVSPLDRSPPADHTSHPGADLRDIARRPTLLGFVRSLLPSRSPKRALRVSRELRDSRQIIAKQRATIAYARRTFERAAEAAQLGLWECELPSERLTWTGGTYDIFGLPRGSSIERQETLGMYASDSLDDLIRSRATAIAAQTGFELEAKIETPQGQERWIRITASVESADGHPVRLFGFKQDITRQRREREAIQHLAEFDVLTGLANRTRFQSEFQTLCGLGAGTLLLIDLDGFKQVNDTAGHIAGDDCLKAVADRLHRATAGLGLVARVGGDEFAVLAGPQLVEEDITDLAWRIVAEMEEPVVCGGRAFTIGASVGVAAIAGSFTDVYRLADIALYAAKSAGGRRARWSQPAPINRAH